MKHGLECTKKGLWRATEGQLEEVWLSLTIGRRSYTSGRPLIAPERPFLASVSASTVYLGRRYDLWGKGIKEVTPIKAIRKFCLECAGSRGEVKKCGNLECSLFSYRFGKNPMRKGIGGLRSLPFWLRNPNSTLEIGPENQEKINR